MRKYFPFLPERIYRSTPSMSTMHRSLLKEERFSCIRASRHGAASPRSTLFSTSHKVSPYWAPSAPLEPRRRVTWRGWIRRRSSLATAIGRTTRGIEQIRSFVEPQGVDVIVAPLPHGPGPSVCLHLMSLISIVDTRAALVDLPWLAVQTVLELRHRDFKLIEIYPSERETMACNVLALGDRKLVALEENEKTNLRLRQEGFEVATFYGTEISQNGGGGPTCLTRPLLRS